MFDVLWQDVRYAGRALLKRPLMASVAVCSLALGIGINTAIFSVFERLLLRPLPVPSPQEIVHVTSPGPKPGFFSSGDGGGPAHIFSLPLFRDLERLENSGFTAVAAHRDFAVNLAWGGATARAGGLLVSGTYFPMLGVAPALGRLFTPDDDRVPGGHPIAVLTHAYWTTRFGADPGVVGDALVVNGQALTVVGVAAPGFTGTETTDPAQIFVPLAMTEQMVDHRNQRNDHWLYVTGRLRPGVTRAQAEAAINVPFASIIPDVEYPAQRRGMGDRARAEFLQRRIYLEDGARGRDSNRDETRIVLALLLAVTGLVLAIACANVANLMLARAADRAGEIAMRLSLGATAGRIIRLLATEALLVGLLGGALALLVAPAALAALLRTMPADDAARLPFELNRTILLFTLALSLGTSLFCGLWPAAHTVRRLGNRGGQPGSRILDTRSTSRVRTSLATAQIALATALLAHAGLFVLSLVNVARVELGIEREGVISFRISPYLNGYTAERSRALFQRIEDALRGLPGVVSVSATTIPVLADNVSTNNLTVEGFTAGPETDTNANLARIGTDYFRTLGIPMLAGRDFTDADAGTAPRVAIVNEAFARKFHLGADVIGRRMATGAGENKPLDIEIVGLVRDARYNSVKVAPPPQFYLPYRQSEIGALTFYARSTGDAGQLRPAIQALVGAADPNLPVDRVRTMDEQIWDNVTTDRVLATLSSWFAGVAILLAAIGLYAVIAYAVARRVREIGVRIALGARTADVWRLVFAQVGRMTAVGVVMGIAAAVALGRLSETLLFGVERTNPLVIAAAAAAIATVTVATAAFPARRAGAIAPAVALRAE
jgi:putative ABC transport system permease protein